MLEVSCKLKILKEIKLVYCYVKCECSIVSLPKNCQSPRICNGFYGGVHFSFCKDRNFMAPSCIKLRGLIRGCADQLVFLSQRSARSLPEMRILREIARAGNKTFQKQSPFYSS